MSVALLLCCVLMNRPVVSESLRLHGLSSSMPLCPCGFSRQEYWSSLSSPPQGESFRPGNRSGVSCIRGGFFTREALLCWLSGKESACQLRRQGFNPWWGKTRMQRGNYLACAPQPMSLCSRAQSSNYWAHRRRPLKPPHREPVLCRRRSPHSEKPPCSAHGNWRVASTLRREKAHVTVKTQHSQT